MKINIELKELIRLEDGLTLLLKSIKNIINEKELIDLLKDEDLIHTMNDLSFFKNGILINSGELILKEIFSNNHLSVDAIEKLIKKNLYSPIFVYIGFYQDLNEKLISYIINEYEKYDNKIDETKLLFLEKVLSSISKYNKNQIDFIFTKLISRSLKHIRVKKNFKNEKHLNFKCSFAENSNISDVYIRELFKDRSSYRFKILKGLASNRNSNREIINYLIKKGLYDKELLMNSLFQEDLFFDVLNRRKNILNENDLIMILKYQIANENITYDIVLKMLDRNVKIDLIKVLLEIDDEKIVKIINEKLRKGY